MKRKPAISIIIPVYNVQDYITDCLESILNQSFTDYEIICINDSSTDNSKKILEQFSQKDDRIKVINIHNSGSGTARNIGIRAAQGKFTAFVDADDKFLKNALLQMYSEAEKMKTDILIFGAYSLRKKIKYKGGYDFGKIPRKFTHSIFSAHSIRNEIFKFPATAWTKLYNTEFIKKNNIQFQDIKRGQDQLFFFHTMITAKRIGVLKKNLYLYTRVRKGSATYNKKKNDFSPICIFYEIEKLLENKMLLPVYDDLFVDKYLQKPPPGSENMR